MHITGVLIACLADSLQSCDGDLKQNSEKFCCSRGVGRVCQNDASDKSILQGTLEQRFQVHDAVRPCYGKVLYYPELQTE